MANIDSVQLPDGSNHNIVDNTSGFATQNYVDAAVASVTKTTIGLGNVDNTSDLNKPISTATQAALDDITDEVEGKADKTDIATVESGTTASKAYGVGELVYVSGTLYRVKTAIASGATFTVGTNVEVTNVSNSIYGLNTDCKSFVEDNIDGYNKLIGRRNNANFRELYFSNFALNAGSTSANVGSYYTPPQDVLFPIMSLNVGIINIRIQGGTGKLFLLGADGSSVSGTHNLFGHVSYTV